MRKVNFKPGETVGDQDVIIEIEDVAAKQAAAEPENQKKQARQ